MKKLTLFVLLMIHATTVSATPALIPDVEQDLQRLIERDKARAIVVGLYDRESVSLHEFGRLSRSDARPPGGDALFEIGSISKVFTSLLTQVQVQAGRLEWDAPIREYLPEVEFASNKVAAITLRELAGHTSGLPRLPDNMDPDDPLDPYAGYERSHLLAFLSGYEPDELSKHYEYSNLGAGLLGVIAAEAVDRSYADAMQHEVLEPLGLGDTAAGVPHNKLSRIATGFSAGADMPAWGGFDALAGAGALVSSVEDMLHFVHRNFEAGALDAALAAIRQPQKSGETGLGWHLQNTQQGDSLVWHNGGTGGYASFIAIRPDNETGVVILSSSTEYMPLTDIGFRQISGRAAATGGSDGTDLDRYAGAYRVAEGFILTIRVEDGRLMGQATGQGAFPLQQTGQHEFSFDAADIRIVFEAGDDDRATKLTLYQAGQVTPAPRVADEQGLQQREVVDIEPAVLADYVGRYQLGPGAIFTIEARDRQLFAQLSGQAAFPVFPFETDKFFYKVVDAQLHFERDSADSVVAVVLHQAGEQRAPRIEN